MIDPIDLNDSHNSMFAVEYNMRQSTQIDDLEQLRAKLGQHSQRSRNSSSDRQFGLIEVKRERKVDRQAQSVEKMSSLKQANLKVESLEQNWKQQKNNSMNNSLVNKSISQVIQEIPEFESPPLRNNVVLEEDEQQDEPEVTQFRTHKPANLMLNSVKGPVKSPQTQTSRAQQQLEISQNEKKKLPTDKGIMSKSNVVRPQTTKNTPVVQPSRKAAVPAQQHYVKQGVSKHQVRSSVAEINTDNASIQSSGMKSSITIQTPMAQTPSQKQLKVVQPTALEKVRFNKVAQAKKQQTIPQQVIKKSDEERQLIIQLQKIKGTVVQLYDKQFGSHGLQHSQNLIASQGNVYYQCIAARFQVS